VPPILIIPRKNLNSRLLAGAPPGTIGAMSPSGWINGDLYLKWLEHFIKYSAASVNRKVLLIVDNHESPITLQACGSCRCCGRVPATIELQETVDFGMRLTCSLLSP